MRSAFYKVHALPPAWYIVHVNNAKRETTSLILHVPICEMRACDWTIAPHGASDRILALDSSDYLMG